MTRVKAGNCWFYGMMTGFCNQKINSTPALRNDGKHKEIQPHLCRLRRDKKDTYVPKYPQATRIISPT